MQTISKYLAIQQFRIYFGSLILVIVLDSLDNLIAFYNGESIVLSMSLSVLLFLPTIALLAGLMSVNGLRQSREFQAANLLGYSVKSLVKPMIYALFCAVAITFWTAQFSLSLASSQSYEYPDWHLQDDILLQLQQTPDGVEVKAAWQLCCMNEPAAQNKLSRTIVLARDQIFLQQDENALQLDITVANNVHKKVLVVPEQKNIGSPVMELASQLESEFLNQEQRDRLVEKFYLQLIILFDAFVFGLIGLLIAIILPEQLPKGFVLIVGIMLAYILSIGKSLVNQIAQGLVTEIWQGYVLYAVIILLMITAGLALEKLLTRQ